MNKKDLKARRAFVREATRKMWGMLYFKFLISLYIDAAGFEYRRNPHDHARTPQAREWRKPNEGLKAPCTGKGSVEGKEQVRFMVGICYERGVVLCERIVGAWRGIDFAKMIRKCFPKALRNSINPDLRRVYQDGCPVQNSKAAEKAFNDI